MFLVHGGRTLDPRLQELAKIHDTRFVFDAGLAHQRQCLHIPYGDTILRAENGATAWPDGLTALDGSDDHFYSSTNVGITGSTDFMALLGVTIPDTSQKGALLKIGNGSSGFGIGLGLNDFDSAGNNLIGLLEGVEWQNVSYSLGTGFHTLAILWRTDSLATTGRHAYHYVDGSNIGGVLNAVTAVAPSADLYIGGYNPGTNRHTTAKIHFAIVAANRNQGASYDMDDLMREAAALYPAGMFVPWEGRRRVFFQPSSGSQDLAASGGSTTTGAAQPAVSYSVAAAAVLATSGSAGPAAAINPQAIGLVVNSGTASPSVSGTVNAAADGTASTSGAAQPSVSMTIAAAAVIESLGQAGIAPSILLNAAGAALTSGNSDIAISALAAAAGSATSTGNAALAAQINALASGVVTVSGIANLASGNQQFGNAAGSVVTVGAAGATLAFTLSAAGSDESGGSVVGTLNVDLTASGIIQMAGAGSLVITAPLAAFGNVTTGGSTGSIFVGEIQVEFEPPPANPIRVQRAVRRRFGRVEYSNQFRRIGWPKPLP